MCPTAAGAVPRRRVELRAEAEVGLRVSLDGRGHVVRVRRDVGPDRGPGRGAAGSSRSTGRAPRTRTGAGRCRGRGRGRALHVAAVGDLEAVRVCVSMGVDVVGELVGADPLAQGAPGTGAVLDLHAVAADEVLGSERRSELGRLVGEPLPAPGRQGPPRRRDGRARANRGPPARAPDRRTGVQAASHVSAGEVSARRGCRADGPARGWRPPGSPSSQHVRVDLDDVEAATAVVREAVTDPVEVEAPSGDVRAGGLGGGEPVSGELVGGPRSDVTGPRGRVPAGNNPGPSRSRSPAAGTAGERRDQAVASARGSRPAPPRRRGGSPAVACRLARPEERQTRAAREPLGSSELERDVTVGVRDRGERELGAHALLESL